MENDNGNSELEDSTVEEEKADDNSILLENEENETSAELSVKELTIAEIMETAKTREDLINKNNSLQHKLSAYIKESAEKDYFQTLDLPMDANEEMLKKSIKKIDEKKQEFETFRELVREKLEYLKSKIKERQEELIVLKSLFTTLKEKVALQSENSEDGNRFLKQEIKELLKKEEDMRKTLEYFQLEAMKKRHILNAALEDKKNLVEGPLDYGEYEIMCTKTENNLEVIKQLNQEIKDFSTKSNNVVNILSHLNQKLNSLQNEKLVAEEKENSLEEELNEMREAMFKEKTKYASMYAKNKELQDKCILLQHPRLLEDHKNIVAENEEAEKEIEELKNTYQSLTSIISK